MNVGALFHGCLDGENGKPPVGEDSGENEERLVAKLDRNRSGKDHISPSALVGSKADDQTEDGGLSGSNSS